MKRALFTYHIYTAIFLVLLVPVSTFAGTVISDTTKGAVSQTLSLNTAETENLEPYMTREFVLSGPGILRVSTLAGNIEVERVPDSSNVRVELYVDRGYAFWSNTKSLDNYRITMLQRGNEVLASVEQKSKEAGFFSDQMTFSYKIYVPKTMSSEISTSAGDILISGMEGQHMIKTGGGKLTINKISGKLGAYSASGNIEISSSSGTLYAQTEAGKLSVQDSQGEIRLKTNAGDITAQRISGSMLARTSSGNISANFLTVSTGISFDVNSGNIDLTIPKKGYDLLLRGSDIEIFDGENFSGTRNKTEVRGALRGGGATINLITKSGEVTLDLEN
ncbi:MAG: hypothetical protein CL670_08245 [Balneola sp.]|nr:hypothetical protein [Balneola sp.]MBE79127.1 hypothetical protein [Balneola sp.]